jgi:hypothetical protein
MFGILTSYAFVMYDCIVTNPFYIPSPRSALFLLQTKLSRIKVPRLNALLLWTILFYIRQFRELGYSLESPQKCDGVLVKAES